MSADAARSAAESGFDAPGYYSTQWRDAERDLADSQTLYTIRILNLLGAAVRGVHPDAVALVLRANPIDSGLFTHSLARAAVASDGTELTREIGDMVLFSRPRPGADPGAAEVEVTVDDLLEWGLRDNPAGARPFVRFVAGSFTVPLGVSR